MTSATCHGAHALVGLATRRLRCPVLPPQRFALTRRGLADALAAVPSDAEAHLNGRSDWQDRAACLLDLLLAGRHAGGPWVIPPLASRDRGLAGRVLASPDRMRPGAAGSPAPLRVRGRGAASSVAPLPRSWTKPHEGPSW